MATHSGGPWRNRHRFRPNLLLRQRHSIIRSQCTAGRPNRPSCRATAHTHRPGPPGRLQLREQLMARLVIGNWLNESELANVPSESIRHIGAQGQRMIWCAQPGDVLVLPIQPDEGFFAYATTLAGVDASSLQIVVPPAGKSGAVLTGDRFEDEDFLAELQRIVRDRGIDRAEPFYLDGYVNRLIERLGLEKSTPGFGFMNQGGNELLNSKVAFRAVATGTNLPIPAGLVTDSAEEAAEYLWELLRSGRSAIAKQDSGTSGRGNEILTATTDVNAIGALHHVVITDRAALADHVAARWSWYTSGLRRRAVFEEYEADSVPVWGEAAITEESVEIYGYGKIRLKPICDGVIIPIPAPDSETEACQDFLRHLQALAETMRAMGYRGLTNVDAILTPNGRVLFNEWNGRYGGSTHLFAIGERVVGSGYLDDRCLIEQRDCAFPAFDVAWRTLKDSGLAYDPAARTGVIIPVYGTKPDGTSGEACIVGESFAAAEQTERELMALFPH
ncbi:peptide ligase PGM1-related protein [Nocardia suismassiliense]|uniref:Peptide ligase PGM1-related protein n=1 Tax=Nocardia suismassiliense TaxID=2077092 RepID=A0ABW6QMD1_9NOCA